MPHGNFLNGEFYAQLSDKEKKQVAKKEAEPLPSPRPEVRVVRQELSTKLPGNIKQAPKDMDAEKTVLGSILIDEAQFFPVSKILNAADFYGEAHRKIFKAMSVLNSQGQPIDLVLITDYLRRTQELERVGSTPYLIGLADSVPVAAYAEYYAEIVKEKSRFREIIRICSKALDEAYQEQSFEGVTQNLSKSVTSLVLGKNDYASQVKFDIERVKRHALGQSVRRTGFISLDTKIGGIPDDDLTVVAARTSHGKGMFITSLVKNIVGNYRKEKVANGEPATGFALYLSPDQSASQIMKMEVAKEIGISASNFGRTNKNGGSLVTDQEIASFVASAENLPNTFLDLVRIRAGGITIDSMMQEILIALEEGCCMIVLDTIQKVQPNNPRAGKRETVEEVSTKLKTLAMEYSVPALVASQVGVHVDKRDLSEYPGRRPMKDDLAEAPRALADDAALMMLLYNHEKHEPNPTSKIGSLEICIAKDKSNEAGTWENNSIALGVQKDLAHLFEPRDLSTMIKYGYERGV